MTKRIKRSTRKKRVVSPLNCKLIFKVSRDYIDDGVLNGKYFVPRGVSNDEYKQRIEWFKSVPKVMCRLRDDDGEIYFHVQIPECLLDVDGGEMAAYPLDGWAMPSYGCVSMDMYDVVKKKFVPFIG